MSTSPERYADELFPEGAHVDASQLTGDLEEAADFVVVGSGAAGAVAAHRLTSLGYSVVVLEEGPFIRTRQFGTSVHDAFIRMFRDAGTQAIEGRSFIPLIQGRCVGGSTAVNSAIAWRIPEEVLHEWRKRFGVPISARELAPHFDQLESDLHVASVADEVLGENSASFLDAGAEIEAHRMRRYDRGCKGSARCLTGCPHAAKQGMNVTYIPWALESGRARLVSNCRVRKVVLLGGRAVAVDGRYAKHRVLVHARHGVIVAASAIQSPNVLRSSGLGMKALGNHFQIHPGLATFGRFDRTVGMNFGASQGAESTYFRASRRFKIETITLQPELALPRMPGVGEELLRRAMDYGKLASWAAVIRAQAEGTVRPDWGGTAKIRLSLTRSDLEATREACATVARLMFQAGAKEVWPGIYGVSPVLKGIDEVKQVEQAPLDSRAYTFITTHLFGTTRMGPDPRSSVVGLDFGVHGTRGLYVVDSGVFPTNLGVNPQHTIMAIARLAADRIAERTHARNAA